MTGTERNRRSEEMLVAAYDPDIEEIDSLGWQKLVTRARAHRRESEVANASALTTVSAGDTHFGDTTLRFGDFRTRMDDLPSRSVDLFVTDPPYPKEDLPLWSEVGKQAARLLGKRGILFAWTGQLFLPEVMDRLGEHLNYGWMFNLMLPGSGARIMGRHMIQGWKPVLAYTTGTWPSGEWGDDVLISPAREKTEYEWQQTSDPAQRLIERYSAPGALVVDPMMGVGSFGIAAQAAGRRFLGVEIDEKRFVQAKRRITSAAAGG